MSDLIEGRNAVLEALRADMPLKGIAIADGVKRGENILEIERLAREKNVEIKKVSRRSLGIKGGSDHHSNQGIVATAKPFKFTPLHEVLAKTTGSESSLIVALDHVTDPQNLGAIARSAEVAGADALLVTKRRIAAIGPAAFKTSAGALAHLPVVQEPNLVRVLEMLKGEGYWVAGASEKAKQSVWEMDLGKHVVLVMGSEDSGLSRLTEETCDMLVSLPVRGKISSLNVAQAATAIIFDWLRQTEGR